MKYCLIGTNMSSDRFISTYTLFKDKYGYNKLPNVIINKDGTVITLHDELNNLYYDGRFIIALENYGIAKKDGTNWVNEKIDTYTKQPWRNGVNWDNFNETQIESLVDILIKDESNLTIIDSIIRDKSYTAYDVVSISNKNDLDTSINPTLDFNKIRYLYNTRKKTDKYG